MGIDQVRREVTELASWLVFVERALLIRIVVDGLIVTSGEQGSSLLAVDFRTRGREGERVMGSSGLGGDGRMIGSW